MPKAEVCFFLSVVLVFFFGDPVSLVVVNPRWVKLPPHVLFLFLSVHVARLRLTTCLRRASRRHTNIFSGCTCTSTGGRSVTRLKKKREEKNTPCFCVGGLAGTFQGSFCLILSLFHHSSIGFAFLFFLIFRTFHLTNRSSNASDVESYLTWALGYFLSRGITTSLVYGVARVTPCQDRSICIYRRDLRKEESTHNKPSG